MQSLQPFHTFGIAVNANAVIDITSADDLYHAWQRNAHQPRLLLGEGSDVLFLQDFHGVVLRNQIKGIEVNEDDSHYYLHVNAGENWHELVQFCVAREMGGLENLALIPGCAGSAPIQNIGAYGVEFAQVCDYVDCLDLNSSETRRLQASQCQFGYRESIFKSQYRTGYAIVAIGIKLAKRWQPHLHYGPLRELDARTVTPREVFAQVCAIRQAKLPNPAELGNAGSFFKNPIVSPSHYHQLQERYPNIPAYPQADGQVKLAAGWLIDQCGLKGKQIGGAAVHSQQALVLVNKGHATGDDVLALSRFIYQQVIAKFGVALVPEVRFYGAQGELDSAEAVRG
ncbi:UDP-N-acetylmuramate dehydrogenase [Pasteurellaceae bacterium HPA106]|uniref:UDP-N-acetylmuramate dehydrogenase n=1 Tax=Spirabiliibacterium pneumoniae TaxID=221400 RepID=UPI001AACE1E4|nr:UDP-N-acetylmuramate dehydrogenase [Spirabiliibacterium pneumoniae]MBE2896047.1 UDP-N-acetylmuramate dehydrogenase [Spirabiliibacterium pneumoniae]